MPRTKESKDKHKIISLEVTKELYQEIEKESLNLSISKGQLIRNALSDFLSLRH